MMSDTRNIGLIWANPYSSNLGVAALAYSALIILEEVSRIRRLQFKYLLVGAKRLESALEISSRCSILIKTRPAFMGGDITRFIKNLIRRPWTMWHYKYLIDLNQCDFLADTGEGDSYADIYGIERFRAFNYVKQTYKKKIPYILLPQTIGPFNTSEARTKAKKSLSKVDAVIARDKQSFDYCKDLEPTAKLYKSIDMAFFLPYSKCPSVTTGKIKIGINVSGLLWEGGYTKDNQFHLKDDYNELVLAILEYLNKKEEYEVHLIGHVISHNKNRHLEIDEDTHILEKIHKQYPDFILAPAFTTPIEAKSYISNMDFFTGARMHACIAAISSGVPVLPMSYSRKFNGLFQDTLSYQPMIDLKVHNRKEALELFMKYLAEHKKLRLQISEIQRNIINPEKQKLVNLISSLIQ